jgi:hypothetical protein
MLAYAKPKIVILDDDHTLLDVMQYYFSEYLENTAIIKTFLKSPDFFVYLEEHCYLPEAPAIILASFYDGIINRENIIQTLHDLADLSAIIVLDHELRGEKVTGICLSKTIREYYPASYVSMLTSNVQQNEAIDLHNNQDIDLFVDKNDINAISNLYKYLLKQINFINKDFLIDNFDLFENKENLSNNVYLHQKKILIENNNPQCFLTLNENGDIALMHEDRNISYWKFYSNIQKFIPYE